jgi:hypothetical protein
MKVSLIAPMIREGQETIAFLRQRAQNPRLSLPGKFDCPYERNHKRSIQGEEAAALLQILR